MAINMGYCRFENTFKALQECIDSIDRHDELSKTEQDYCERMLELFEEYKESYELNK